MEIKFGGFLCSFQMGLIWFFFCKEGPYSDWNKILVELLGLSDQLATLLAKERTHSQTYIGCMKKGLVITDPKMKWYEKSGHLIGNEYFRHAYGPIYVLSAEVVASLAIARNSRNVIG